MKKIILITGISSGIGEAFINNFYVRENYKVIGISRNKTKTSSKSVDIVTFDIGADSINSLGKLVNKVISKYGHIDVLINNAGVGYKGTIEDLPIKDIQKQFEVNVLGYLKTIKTILPIMKKQRCGHIINVSSIGGTIRTPTLGYYAATKSMIDALSEVLLQEIEDQNINVSLFLPGAVKSSFGKHFRGITDYSKSNYEKLYEEWDTRFRNFFSSRNTAEEAAQGLVSLIEKPRLYKYISWRDKLICISKRVLPFSIHTNLILKQFFRK